MDITIIPKERRYDDGFWCDMDGEYYLAIIDRDLYWSCINPAIVEVDEEMYCKQHIEDSGLTKGLFALRV